MEGGGFALSEECTASVASELPSPGSSPKAEGRRWSGSKVLEHLSPRGLISPLSARKAKRTTPNSAKSTGASDSSTPRRRPSFGGSSDVSSREATPIYFSQESSRPTMRGSLPTSFRSGGGGGAVPTSPSGSSLGFDSPHGRFNAKPHWLDVASVVSPKSSQSRMSFDQMEEGEEMPIRPNATPGLDRSEGTESGSLSPLGSPAHDSLWRFVPRLNDSPAGPRDIFANVKREDYRIIETADHVSEESTFADAASANDINQSNHSSSSSLPTTSAGSLGSISYGEEMNRRSSDRTLRFRPFPRLDARGLMLMACMCFGFIFGMLVGGREVLQVAAYCSGMEHALEEGCRRGLTSVKRAPAQTHETCCPQQTASCLACRAGVTAAEYCERRPHTDGCGGRLPVPADPCCEEYTAKCLACRAGISPAEFCDQRAAPGCDDVRGKLRKAPTESCCKEETADCIACRAGVTTASICAERPLPGCEGCCEGGSAPCRACREGVPVDKLCEQPGLADLEGCPKAKTVEQQQPPPPPAPPQTTSAPHHNGKDSPAEALRNTFHQISATEPPDPKIKREEVLTEPGHDGGGAVAAKEAAEPAQEPPKKHLRVAAAPVVVTPPGRAARRPGQSAKGCCKEDTAACYACAANISVADVCGILAGGGRLIVGCEGTPGAARKPAEAQRCCTGNKLECLACRAGMAPQDFCMRRPNFQVEGCFGFCGLQEFGYDYPGGTFHQVPTIADAQTCCSLCRAEARCTSWTWSGQNGGICQLKRQERLLREPRSGFISGLPGSDQATYQLRDYHGMCLDAAGSVRVQECGEGAALSQWWAYERQSAELSNRRGICVYSPELGQLGEAHEGPCEPAWSSSWAYNSSNRLVHNRQGLCLEAPGGKRSGQLARARPCSTAQRDQQWELWTSRKAPERGTPTPPNKTSSALRSGATSASLFCFALMVPWGYERELLAMQFAERASIFACEESAVYSNTVVDLGGLTTSVVDADLHCELGGKWHTAMNAPVFRKLWQQVTRDGLYQRHDWTVKVDPDAVFSAERLRSIIYPDRLVAQAGKGVFLGNCKFGFHGPLEVLSRKALLTYSSGWLTQCGGPDLAPQEDAYIAGCLQKLGVQQLDRFDTLLAEAACQTPDWEACGSKQASFHPFKTIPAYKKCLAAVARQDQLSAPAKVASVVEGASAPGSATPRDDTAPHEQSIEPSADTAAQNRAATAAEGGTGKSVAGTVAPASGRAIVTVVHGPGPTTLQVH